MNTIEDKKLIQVDERKRIVVDLTKKNGIEGIKSTVVFVLDTSYSMDTLFANGTVQETMERILPIGLVFDDNGEVDFYTFSNRFRKHANLSVVNFRDYIRANNIRTDGGTEYSHVIAEITRQFGNQHTIERSGGTGGFLGFGKKEATESVRITSPLAIPVFVIFLTDGESNDHEESRIAIRNASAHGIFFQFVGIGGARFQFLQELDDLTGRVIDNANFFQVPDLQRTTDEQLYAQLMNEYPSWIKLAKSHRIIS